MPEKPEFIYNTPGDWQATKMGPYLFDGRGDWIGFVNDRDVYTRDGEWIGTLSKDGRVLRKRTTERKPLTSAIPPKPAYTRADLPGRAPLPMQMAELGFDMIDVLDEDPEIFKRLSDLRPDLD